MGSVNITCMTQAAREARKMRIYTFVIHSGEVSKLGI